MDSFSKPDYRGAERRAFPRLSINIEIDYTVVDQDLPIQQVSSSNISAGGICFIAYEKLDPGTLLFLSFRVDSGIKEVSARGKVVWQEESFSLSTDSAVRYDTGVEFVEIDDKDREIISHYVVSFPRNNLREEGGKT